MYQYGFNQNFNNQKLNELFSSHRKRQLYSNTLSLKKINYLHIQYQNECLPKIECSICKNRIFTISCFRAIVLFKVTGNIRYKLNSPIATQKTISFVATEDKLIHIGSSMGTQFSDFYIGVKKCN